MLLRVKVPPLKTWTETEQEVIARIDGYRKQEEAETWNFALPFFLNIQDVIGLPERAILTKTNGKLILYIEFEDEGCEFEVTVAVESDYPSPV
jgi:hypothetical protein